MSDDPQQAVIDFLAAPESHGGAELIERRKVKPFGFYTLVRFRRLAQERAAA